MNTTKPTLHYYVAGLILCLFHLTAWANKGQLYTSDRMSSSLIKCLVQDRQGYVWVGTEFGLSRFDGYHFQNYLHAEDDATTIADNSISSFLVDKEGNLWIGSAKGLMRYDYHRNSFVQVPLSDGRKPRIYSLIEHDGDVLVGTAGFGLYAVEKGSQQAVQLKEYCPQDSDMFYTHIYEDSHGNLWQSSHQPQFNRFHRRNGKMAIETYSSPCGAPIAFFQPRESTLLIVCMSGIMEYDYPSGRLQDAGFSFGKYQGNMSINCAYIDHKGNLLVGTSECGVLVCPRGSTVFTPFETDNESRFSLSTAFVNDIFEDKDNNLWIGCYKKGLYLVSGQMEAFSSWSFASQDFVIGSSVTSLATGIGGETLCTVQNSGVFCFDRDGKIIRHPASPTGTCIIHRDQQGAYWVATPNGLYSYNPVTGASVQRLQFTSQGVPCICDADGRLFISVYSNGLYILDTRSGDVKVVNMSQHTSHGSLCNDWIRAMTFDGQGLLWLATSNGVACMNPTTYAFDSFGWESLLHNIQSNSLCKDGDGNIIIGTDEGIYLYSIRTQKAERFPNSDILNDKQICGIVRDAQGDLWISTTKGLWQYDHKRRSFIGHMKGNGLKFREYMQGAVLAQADFIAFGAPDGIVAFRPDDIRNYSLELGDVRLTNFLVDGKTPDIMRESFRLPYSQNSFVLEFSVMNYSNADDISYQYRINGARWMPTEDGSNAISFTKLAPGRYEIEVRTAYNGTFSKDVKRLAVTVSPPWYASWWAWLLYAVIIGAVAHVMLRSYLQRRKADLDEQKMKFLIDATHDIRSPLTLIVEPLKKLKGRITDGDNRRDIDTIDRNAQRLLLLVNQILDERRIDKGQMKLHCQETELVEFVRTIMAVYSYNAHERNIVLRLFVDGKQAETARSHRNIKVWIDRINFDKVISNLLSNALKYTFNDGQIDVMISSDDKEAVIKVADTGIGFKEENTDKLFERFYQGRNTWGFHIEGTGIGLNLTRSLVQMHGGRIKAYNRTDTEHGACVQVNLKLGNAHLKPEETLPVQETATEEPRRKQASRNFRVLIVDDDYEIVKYIRSELSDWYRFDHASNGKEALKKLLTERFDVVVTDVLMPEMDGITMLRQLKSNPNISDIPVILLTAKGDVSDRLEGLRKGADAFLAKPFSMEELHILIDNLVDNVRRLRGKYSGVQEQKKSVEQVQVTGNNDLLMKRIMLCVNRNLTNPDFNVEMLTTEVGISRAQLHRKMKEITGIPTGEFIRNLRMEQAARLIREGDINVTQAAYAVGFNNQTHFSTVFKKRFGMTPTEYAESGKDMGE